MGGIRCVQDRLALRPDGGRLAGVQHSRGQQPDPGVVVLGVVPAKENLAPSPRVGQATKEGLEARGVLERLELGSE
jgi:hypothetical protein